MLPVEGTIVPLVTPFDSTDRIDSAAVGRLVAHILEAGADALMPTALTGEGPLLTGAETEAMWEATFAAAAGRVPVVPAVIATTTREAVRLASRAHAMGAAAVMTAPIVPELYAGRSRSDVRGFIEAVADATPLPVILFNYPSLTGVDLTPDFLAELADIPRVAYVKESTADSRRVHAIHRRCEGRIEVICGNPNAALESMALGCRLWITGILNVVPREARAMLHAVILDADLERARTIYYERVLPLVDLMFETSNPTGVIKAGLRARGVGVGVPRPPGSDLAAGDLARLAPLVSRA
ncbi:MAG: dihydrodipicolinate synthase family protein [Acidobacteria bacterium]|nr:dihydrodipicolinate synthase family protein [Acidobacteriota bacterium]